MSISRSDLDALTKFLHGRETRVFGQKTLLSVLGGFRKQRSTLSDSTAANLLDAAVSAGIVEKRTLASDRYAPYIKYALPDATILETAAALRTGSYLSHGTAVFLHHLGFQLPRIIYSNKEQSPKPPPTGGLSQEGIANAFANQQRESRYVLTYGEWQIVLLNGKNTKNLEVGNIRIDDGASVSATKLERTLIDIAVRPNYSGGVHQVLESYRAARDLVSVNVLVATLLKMGYVYPYHQVIGFYMQRAGYEAARLNRLREIGMKFDFYLTYGMKGSTYDPEWRLFIPADF